MPISKMPKFLKEPRQFMDYASKAFTSGLARDASRLAVASGAEVKTLNSKRMVATIKTLANRGVVDLKPFILGSPKTKTAKDGTPYQIVPIRVTRRGLRGQFGSDKMYQKLRDATRNLDAGTSATVNVNDIFSGRQTDTMSILQPPTAMDNITAKKSQTGQRTTYLAYRTVSAKSKPQSWVINRGAVSDDDSNTSKSLQKGIAVMMRKRVRQAQGKFV